MFDSEPNVESDNNIPIPDGFETDFKRDVQPVINQKIIDGKLDKESVITGVLTQKIIHSKNTDDVITIGIVDERNRDVGNVTIHGWKIQ